MKRLALGLVLCCSFAASLATVPSQEPAAAAIGKASRGGTVSPDGAEEIACDLPKRFHLRNRGGSDGYGLCVFASLQHASLWQHIWATTDIFPWMFTRPGGGYPEKVDRVIKQMCAEKQAPVPAYVQVQNRDLEILKLACRTGRMPSVTYNYSPTGNYGGQLIDHMVTLAHASDAWFGVLDNNFPQVIEWMDPQTFLKVYTRHGRRNGWSVIFLDPGPPAPPRNASAPKMARACLCSGGDVCTCDDCHCRRQLIGGL